MSENTGGPAFGWRAFGLGVMSLGLVGLLLGDFVGAQSVPKDVPARTILAYAAATVMLLGGAAVQWRRTTAWAAAALALYFGVAVLCLMDGRIVLRHFKEFLAYETTAEGLGLTAGAVILWVDRAGMKPGLTRGIARWARRAFGVAAIVFGLAHFFYMNLTAPLVPRWLPPSQVFWGYATGVAHIAGGLALLSGVQARLAAILLTVMYAAFTPLVHLPMLFNDPHNHFIWTENATNLALTGAAWVIADSLRRRGSKS